MVDIRTLREQPESIKENLKKKFQTSKVKFVDEALKKDADWRKLEGEADTLRSERNKISKEISELKKAGKNADAAMKKAKKLPEEIEDIETQAQKKEEEVQELLNQLPNIMHPSVPLGKDASENVTLKTIGKPSAFSFPVKSHVELGETLDILDFDSSARTSGNGFYYLKGDLALLNQALIRFGIDLMVKRG